MRPASMRWSAALLRCHPARRTGATRGFGQLDHPISPYNSRVTLTGMKKHVDILEQGRGSMTTQKVGRERTCKLGRLPAGRRGRPGSERHR